MAPDPLEAIAVFFAPSVFAAGRSLLGRDRVAVRSHRQDTLVAAVQGERKRPYRTEVVLRRDAHGGVAELRGTCACPVGHRCEHVAAVASMLWAKLCPDPEQAAAQSLARSLQWAHALGVDDGSANERPVQRRASRQVHYILDPDGTADAPPLVHTVAVTPRRGGWGSERAVDLDAPAQRGRSWVPVEDRLLYAELRLREHHSYGYRHLVPRLPADETGPQLLRQLIATGRAHLGSVHAPPLRWRRARRAEVGWHIDHRGTQRPALLGLAEPLVVLPLRPPHWVDPADGRCGKVRTDLAPKAAQALGRALALPPEAAARLPPGSWPTQAGVAAPRRVSIVAASATAPQPVLTLSGDQAAVARLHFAYGPAVCDPDEPHDDASIVSEATVVVRAPRQRASEQRAVERLTQTGLVTTEALAAEADGRWPSWWRLPQATDAEAHDEFWFRFTAQDVPALRAEGWRVEIEPSFSWALATVDAWVVEADEIGDGGWLSVSLGVEVEGVCVPVLPALRRALAGEAGMEIPERGIVLQLAPDKRVRMSAERLRGIVEILVEVLGSQPLTAGRLRLPRVAAARLEQLSEAASIRFLGSDRLRAVGEALSALSRSQWRDVPPPAGLRAQLRGYQRRGVAWLAALGSLSLGGVLADDMGLGKTLQTLAYVLHEHAAGRLDRPCLVVAPTSVLPVWIAETQRFCPTLSAHLHHGRARAKSAAALRRADVVVTSYALALRDRALLAGIGWHVLVLDEAQAIKNPSAKISRAVRRIGARTRVALTGTPLQNDLTELWAVLDFVVPGLLGTARQFASSFRTPIAVHGDATARRALVHRIAPFVLRRTKDEVLPELPPKTCQRRYAELGPAQRDLYETVRLGADARVQQLLAAKGLSRARIGVLAALLKLREVCCDPRLVPYGKDEPAESSAKLSLLLSLLADLLAAGRRVVVFSQFTRMLTLIGRALDDAGIGWAKLTGRTKDRVAPQQRFARGEVPILLVSLKAGGVGIDLTAADTVIHYEPWWNPAAQDQATDRTHRIGQRRPVLELSLVARGTVEEAMLTMHADKRALADGVLGAAAAPAAGDGAAFGPEVLAALLAPLPTR